jgi:hypothetical protein
MECMQVSVPDTQDTPSLILWKIQFYPRTYILLWILRTFLFFFGHLFLYFFFFFFPSSTFAHLLIWVHTMYPFFSAYISSSQFTIIYAIPFGIIFSYILLLFIALGGTINLGLKLRVLEGVL